jgi:hypothetical protein
MIRYYTNERSFINIFKSLNAIYLTSKIHESNEWVYVRIFLKKVFGKHGNIFNIESI